MTLKTPQAREHLEELRRQAHEAPLNKVGMDHKGHRHLLTHSMAWATASRRWCEAMAAFEKAASSSEAKP